ncbi:MAG: hypothetical protein ACFFDT_26875, partial [Candidatus Hodarchaeota archaeon]
MSLKDLFEQRKYQEILNQVERFEKKGSSPSTSVSEQVDRIYYQSRALGRLGHHEKVLHLIIQNRERLSPIQDKRDNGVSIDEYSEKINITWNSFLGNHPEGNSQAFDDGIDNWFA